MKHLKSITCILAIAAAVLSFAACDSDKPADTAATYTVKVPQFAEGNSKTAKGITIDEEVLNNDVLVNRFFSYRIAPPITGFKEQTISNGSTFNTSLFGNQITVSMNVDPENGSYIFTGKNDSEYIYFEINKDNTEFSYAHSLILDVGNTDDEFDVVLGRGVINGDTFDSRGTAYYLGQLTDSARYNFLIHGDSSSKGMAWYCYSGFRGHSTNNRDIESYLPENYATYIQDAVFEASDSEMNYVAKFNSSLLDFESLNVPELSVFEAYVYSLDPDSPQSPDPSLAIGFASLVGYNGSKDNISEVKAFLTDFLPNLEFMDPEEKVETFTKIYILSTNGLGDQRDSAYECITTIGNWFSDISSFLYWQDLEINEPQ